MQAIFKPHGFRGRRAGAGPAVVSALALHAACLGALVGLGHLRPTPPPQETVVELAIIPAPEPSALPEPPALPEPAPSPPAAPPIGDPIALPPEPAEAKAAPAETPLPPPAEPDPAPVETLAPPLVEPPPPEPAAVATPPPKASPRPPPQPVHAPPQLPQHTATLPRPTPAHQEIATSGAPASSATATPTTLAALGPANREATLEARIRDAVQAAVHYPASARMMGITGRARLLLDYRSGNVAGPMLAQSSGAPTLDEAALAAARAARYPPAPPEIEGRLLRLLVWVEFRPG